MQALFYISSSVECVVRIGTYINYLLFEHVSLKSYLFTVLRSRMAGGGGGWVGVGQWKLEEYFRSLKP